MFKIGRVELPYCRDDGYNTPARNERTVELPLAQHFLKTGNPRGVVEVGAVTPYHIRNGHAVIDPTDPHPGCVRQDARAVDYRGMDVLSISTIEHIGNGEFGDKLKDNSAFDLIRRIASESPRFLISFPLGYNANLDVSVRTSDLPRVVLKRINAENDWQTCDTFDFCYNHPFNNGNAICVVTNLPDLLRDTADIKGLRKLNLGSGDDYREGWVNVDVGHCRKDVEHDLESLPLPFADSQFHTILLQHVIEHISRDRFPQFMRELHRIGAPGCRIHIAAPYFNSKNAWTDFTHKNFITEESFGYFDSRHHLRHLGVVYGFDFTFNTLAISKTGPEDNLTISFDLEVEKSEGNLR